MKIVKINGFKYSREEFEDYTNRAIFRLGIDTDWRNDRCITIYTNNPNKFEVDKVILSRTTDKVRNFIMEHWSTKEQDEITSQFIEETLKDI